MRINLKVLLFSLLIPLVFFSFPSAAKADTCLNPSDNPCWIAKSPMPTARRDLGVAADAFGKIYAVGGYTGSDFTNVLEVYDPATDTWTTKSPIPVARNDMGFTFNPVNGKFYLGGGYNNGALNDFYEYDPVADAWTAKASMPTASIGLRFAAAQNGEIYSIGGGYLNGTQVSNVEEYDPVTDVWTTKSAIPTPRADAGLVAASNGKMYLIGGGIEGGSIASVDEYDPAVDTWVTKSPMSVARAGLAVSLNSNGNVYAVGGNDPNGEFYIDTVEEYQISSDTWTARTSFPVGSHALRMALGGDGNVYVIGGQTVNSPAVNTNYAGIPSSAVDLNVPLLKQTNPFWGSFTYNSADEWAPPEPTDIARWGCALTSAAMVLQYHKITKLPSGIDLNPGTLNVWLLTHKEIERKYDGYVRNGEVNWLALNRLSKFAKDQNPEFGYGALDYVRFGENHEQLKNDPEDNIPGILGVNNDTHFVVAKGVNNEGEFTINDPFYNRDNLNSYSNHFSSLGRFIPSNTDLSYIMLVVDDSVNISVENSSGEPLGESFIQQPLENEDTPGDFSGEPLRIFYLSDPTSGDYQIFLSSGSLKKYLLDAYYYDINGEVNVEHFNGVVGPRGSDQYSIQFDKDDSNNSSSKENVTFDSLINDIKYLYGLGEIKNFNTYISLLTKAKIAKGVKEIKPTAKAILKSIQREVGRQRGRALTENAYKILSTDINLLMNTL